jgi:hypothetical protein
MLVASRKQESAEWRLELPKLLSGTEQVDCRIPAREGGGKASAHVAPPGRDERSVGEGSARRRRYRDLGRERSRAC